MNNSFYETNLAKHLGLVANFYNQPTMFCMSDMFNLHPFNGVQICI